MADGWERILPFNDGQGGPSDRVVEFETVECSGSTLDLVTALYLENNIFITLDPNPR